jgi:putative membrane protein
MKERIPLPFVLIFVAGAALSAIGCRSYSNWLAESALVLAGGGMLAAASGRLRFTSLVYGVLLVLALLVFTGAHYTYAEVPLGDWMKSAFHLKRNDFDRVAHFFQGAAPGLVLRELCIRRWLIRRNGLLFWVVTGMCLGLSALWELMEWHYAVAFGPTSTLSDLGAQGDPWDTQEDMQMALVGAMTAQLLLGRWHDRQILRATAASPDHS